MPASQKLPEMDIWRFNMIVVIRHKNIAFKSITEFNENLCDPVSTKMIQDEPRKAGIYGSTETLLIPKASTQRHITINWVFLHCWFKVKDYKAKSKKKD